MDLQLPQQVLLYRSSHPFQTQVKQLLSNLGIEYLELSVLAELTDKSILEVIPLALAVVDDQDQDGLDLLRSIMHSNNWIQRVMLSDTVDFSLLEYAINKAHINYLLHIPFEKDKFAVYLAKAWRRFKNITQPLEKFNTLASITEDLLAVNEKFRLEANTDSLTHLLNRRSFNNVLSRFWNLYKKERTIFSLAMLDIDHFKKINDQYGHQAGDRVLKFLGEVFQKNQRLGQDFAFRYGGEEFAILSSATNQDEMKGYIHRLLSIVRRKKVYYQDQEIRFTFSGGVCSAVNAQSAEELINKADQALYAAKQKGRNRIEIAK